MKPLDRHTLKRVPTSIGDSVEKLRENTDDPPAIVSISDIHGFREDAKSTLLTLSDHQAYDPVVREDSAGTLHWANNNYVLVFNGDLVDRGPENKAVLEMASRLTAEAPVGRVRITLGNHEAIALSPSYFGFTNWYSGQVDDEGRQVLTRAIKNGVVIAAYEGYNVTYAHAGSPKQYQASIVNESLKAAADDLQASIETLEDTSQQRLIVDEYSDVLGVGRHHLKGSVAGLVWLDFSHLPEDAPPQVVGHTRFRHPQQKGLVFCQNVIRENRGSAGGEAVFVETPTALHALIRKDEKAVHETKLAEF